MMKPPQYTNLQPLLHELIAHGLTQADIAREIHLTRATVSFAVNKTGKWMPGYDTGSRLVALYLRNIGKEPANV